MSTTVTSNSNTGYLRARLGTIKKGQLDINKYFFKKKIIAWLSYTKIRWGKSGSVNGRISSDIEDTINTMLLWFKMKTNLGRYC